MVKLEQEQAAPDPIVAEFSTRLTVAVPIVKSNLRTNARVRNEPQVAVPEAPAFAPVIVFTVSVPADAAGANVAEHARVTSVT
jgi:hypothetical protein